MSYVSPSPRSTTPSNGRSSMPPPPSRPVPRPPASLLQGSSAHLYPVCGTSISESNAPSPTSSCTPHPEAARISFPSSARPCISSYGSQSVASLSHTLGQRGNVSTASGRKSRVASSVWGSEGHQVICAVCEARGVSPSVGLAFLNITTNEAILSQICDSQFYVKTLHKIQLYDPGTILLVNTAFPPNPKSNLLSVIEEEFQGINIEPLDRKYWSETAGLEFVHAFSFREDLESIQVALQGSFYASCSFAAVIKYMERACHLTIVSHSLRIRYQPSENSLMIDISTIQSLELIQNLQNAKSKYCLLGLLNETSTPMGNRMLRSNILQPSTQIEHTLNPRFDALDELTTKEHMFFEIKTALKSFSDVETLLTKLVILPARISIHDSEVAINQVLMIKSFVASISPLHEALGSARSELLLRIRDICRPELTQPIDRIITATINDDVSYMESPINLRHQRTYAVKTGVLGLLDVARQIYKEGVDDVHEHVENLSVETDIIFQIKYEENRKYFIRAKECDIKGRDIPDVLINRVRRSGYLECQTLGLVQLNNRITDSHNETVLLSDKVIHELLDAIRGHIANLYRVCEGIALLDMLMAFGHSVTSRDYVRPEFGDTLALKGARHPICEVMKQGIFVPNDVYAGEDYRFQIITGCNMSGKSTYIRMIALLQVMAQIGCFVPAEYAAFPVVHQLFVRMSTDDSIESNLSTFSTEMREMAFILRNINGRSLAIIDELGRGTSTRDGLAIALAISEVLIQSNSLVWFVTHFHQLAKILGSRPGVLNLHLDTDMSLTDGGGVPKMIMLYTINSGPLDEEHYGLNLAKVVGFPGSFLEIAETASKALQYQIDDKKHNSQYQKLKRRRGFILTLYGTLRQMQGGHIDDAALGNFLINLQREFVSRLDKIDSASDHMSESDEFGVSEMPAMNGDINVVDGN